MPSRARLRRLHDANDEMFASLDLDHRLRSAVRSARDLVPADAAVVFLPTPEGDALVVRAHDGLSDAYATRQRLPIEDVRAQFRAAGEHVILEMPAGSVVDGLWGGFKALGPKLYPNLIAGEFHRFASYRV